MAPLLLAALLVAQAAAGQATPEGAAPPPQPRAPIPAARPVLQRPRLVEFTAADYPSTQLLRGIEAQVPVRLQIAATGEVTSVQPEAGEPDPFWFSMAQAALLKARFEPARVGGKPASTAVRFTYRWATQRPPAETDLEVARTSTLHGEVLAGGQRVAVPGVDVMLQGLAYGATTDAKGRFEMKVPPGSHVLVVAAPGFLAMQTRVDVPAGNDADVTLYPRRTEVGELSATVQGERARTATAPTKQTMVHEELRNVPGSQADPIRVLENLPGLARAPFSGGQLIVRGARPNDTGAYIDGQKIPILYHLLNGPSVLSEDMVDRIDFLPGGADVFYGRNLQGVVSVVSKRGDPDRLHGSVTSDLNKSSGFLQGPLGHATQFAVGVRRSYINPIVSLITDPQHELTLPVYWDYQARVDHQLASGDRLSLLVYGSDDSYAVAGGGQGSIPLLDGLHIGFHRLKLSWEKRINDALTVSASPLIGFDINDHNQQGTGSGAFTTAQSEEERTLSWGLRSEAHLRVSPWLSVRAGTDLIFDRVRYKLDQLYDTQLRSIGAPNAEQSLREGVRTLNSFGEYLEAELKLGSFRITPGVRLEQMHWSGNTYLLTEPRLWARFEPDRATSIYAYAGLYHEAPTAQALDQLLGNPNLLPERAEQYGVGFSRKFLDVWSIKVEGFFNRRASLVFPAAPRARGDGTFDNPLQVNSGIGRSVGVEVLLRRELTAKLYGWIAYTLSRSRESSAPGQPWLPTAYDQPHVLTLLFGFRPSTQVEFSTRLRVASGNPESPVTGATFDADSGSFTASRLPFGAGRLPTFVQLDFEINNIWSADLYQLSLYLDFQNVLNRRNPEYLVYDYRFLRSDAVHSLPFLASVGVKVSF